MLRLLYFDLETKYSAEEVGGWANVMDMGMSVGVLWDSLDLKHHVYLEHQAPALIRHLRQGDLIVGFNHVAFDLRVLAGSRPTEPERQQLYLELVSLHHFDMLVELKKVLGHRLRLDSIARPTLQHGKSADGLQALSWYKEGRIDKIIEYCKQDVEVTRLVHEHALQHGQLSYDSRQGIKTVALNWSLREPAVAVSAEQMSLFD
jgi:DEAD/DEAH box helicase domain-containing protein